MCRHRLTTRPILAKRAHLRRAEAQDAGMQPASSFLCGESTLVFKRTHSRRHEASIAGMRPAFKLSPRRDQGKSGLSVSLKLGISFSGLASFELSVPQCKRHQACFEASRLVCWQSCPGSRGPSNQRLKLTHGCLFASLTGSWRSLTRSLGGINESIERTEDRFLRSRH